MSQNLTAEQIVRATVDSAGEAGGIDEVRRIAANGAGDMTFDEASMAVLLEAYGTPGDAMYAIQLEAQNRVSLLAQEAREASAGDASDDTASETAGV